MKTNIWDSIFKKHPVKRDPNSVIVFHPDTTSETKHDIYKDPTHQSIRSNILTKQTNIISHFNDMAFVASLGDDAIVLPAPFKMHVAKTTPEERETMFQNDRQFTREHFKKNIAISRKLDEKNESRSKLYRAIQAVYPDFGQGIEHKLPKDDFELLHDTRKILRHIFSESFNYDMSVSQSERLITFKDNLSEVVDSPTFAKACSIEDRFVVDEIDKFFEMYKDASPEAKKGLTVSDIITHDSRKTSALELIRKVKTERLARLKKYEEISGLYEKLGTKKEVKIIIPDDDIR